MSKLTPIILAAIMLASTSLAALDWTELEERKTTEADGRTGPDAEILAIMSPRETTINPIDGEVMHAIDAGESVTFEMYIHNVGDTDIEDMGVSVEIYLAEGGSRGEIAKDANGRDLSWHNNDVVCGDSFVCPWSSVAADNGTLNNGRYIFAYQGTTINWIPVTGNYKVVIKTHAIGDVDFVNDEMEIDVSVVDWTDIIVDLSWDNDPVKEFETGAGTKDFKLTVSTGGSLEWSARNITLEFVVDGKISTATEIQGGSDMMGTTTHATFGTYGLTETFSDENRTNVQEDNRYYIDFGTEYEWFGSIEPDTSGDSGPYSISVSLVSYVVYGQQEGCEVNNSGGSGPSQGGVIGDGEVEINFCEIAYGADTTRAVSSEDTIEGYIGNYHDIGITELVINQGYGLDENNLPNTEATITGIVEGPLNPVLSSVQAEVAHLGSDETTIYDWEVEFEIENTITGQVTVQTANECEYNPGEDYEHMKLGQGMSAGEAQSNGLACILFDFVPGIYNVTATLSMVNETVMDQSSRNDKASMNNVAALNNRPSVSLVIEEDPNSVSIGRDSYLTLVADAYDADDEFGDTLRYVWEHPDMVVFNGTPEPSPCDGVGPDYSTCLLTPATAEYASVNPYTVTVYDLYGSSATDVQNFFIWNYVEAAAVTTSGIIMEYNLSYNGVAPFNIGLNDSTDDDGNAEAYTQDLTQFGYAGEYESVAVLDYTPSTNYLAEDVHEQSITIRYDTSAISPTSIFWVNSNGVWFELDATFSESGTDGTIALDYGTENTQTLSGGEIVLMGGELQLVETPTANPVNLTVVATKGGAISASWAYSGNAVPGLDYLSLEICDSQGVCTTSEENTSLVAHLMSGQTETTHGENYTYTLQVCNIAGCNPTIATDSAVADNMVDGGVTATDMSVESKSDSAWTVSWTVSGDDSDVAGWMVCMADYSWSSSGEMPTSICVDAGDATSVDVPHPGGTGTKTYYFAAVAYDDKNNMDNAMPGTDTVLTHANTITDPCEVDPDGDECAAIGDSGDSADSGEVPTWTWGVIIGLVVVAFVVGAFILSRGGDGEDGKDWDY